MTTDLQRHKPLAHGSELNAVYAIARIVAEAPDTESGLDAVFRLARTIFIFDVVSLFLADKENDELEPTYARALGRGRSRESELDWGEPAASESYRTVQTVLRRENSGSEISGRDRRRDFLGVPLIRGGHCVGSLVFGRFGGPSFPSEHIRLAEFVAWHVGQLLESERMALRIATLEAQRELARLQDEFMATISHELRSPLGFIKGYVTTLLRDDVEWEPETRDDFLRIIDEESDRLRALIDDLLDSSRLRSGLLTMIIEPCKISMLIRDTVTRNDTAYPDMDIHVEIEQSLPQVLADSTRIAQVLDNLISNAHKYAPGSPVTVRVWQTDDQVFISISDQGPGIPSQHMPHLFDRFFQVPNSEKTTHGSGLGLYICRKIIEEHGGMIQAKSKPGQGTTFTFSVPVSDTEHQSPMEKENESPE